MDHLRRCHWPTISRDFPPEFVQSECCFKSIFRPWLGIERPRRNKRRLLRKHVRHSPYSAQWSHINSAEALASIAAALPDIRRLVHGARGQGKGGLKCYGFVSHC
jgi:hypothetical protein